MHNSPDFDILLIQEPAWNSLINAETGNPDWQHILPSYPIPPETRARVQAYTRKQRTDFSVTLRSDIANDLDLQVLEIRQGNFPPTIIANIYNDPRAPGTCASARLRGLNLPIDTPVVLTGDWNLHHPLWEPSKGVEPNDEAEAMVGWLDENGFTMMNPPDEPTYHSHCQRYFSTIDLTFANSPADDADTVRDWAVLHEKSEGSDHSAIKWIIDYGSTPRITETDRKTWVWKSADKELFCDTVSAVRSRHSDALQTIRDPNLSTGQLDQAATAIREILTEAADAAAPTRRPSSRAKPFWTDELTDLRDETIRARNRCRDHTRRVGSPNPTLVSDLKHAENVFTRVFRKTRNRKWTEGRRTYPSPPISRSGRPAAIQHKDKCEALREELFPTSAPLPHHHFPDLSRHRADAFPEESVTYNEVCDAIFAMDHNKAPGPDGIPILAIQWAWEVIADDFLFARCAELGYHPAEWHDSIYNLGHQA
ncbi:hypothetical protein FRB90_002806 [Tulasnella sp. 427]|nr:hypothetical protein FRB90_002806 [Tulasnella sp. 427]